MSYAAEPYAQFVDDLLTALTGGVVRERFVYLPDEEPFRLSPPGAIIPSTLKVFGQREGAFHRFKRDVDFELTTDKTITWLPADRGGARPDLGAAFFVNYDHKGPAGAAPLLSDRNPGSVVRLLAESFAREYAVLSKQLESVYRAGFLDTAEGRDLDQLVALVGLTRHSRARARGTVVFSRGTPAGGDIDIKAGTRLSTRTPPAAVFETTDDAVLVRGSLSVEVPIVATVDGRDGVVVAQAIQVLHRPVFGIDRVSNPQPTELGGKVESDEGLRARARRALEAAGRMTPGALVGRVASLPGLREKDIQVGEDPLKRPGVVVLKVAAELDEDACRQVLDIVERTRPAGVRVVHQLECRATAAPAAPGAGLLPEETGGEPEDSTTAGAALFDPLLVKAIVRPASSALPAGARDALKAHSEAAIRAAVDEVGVDEPLVYNKVVAALMAVDGLLDVAVELLPVRRPTGARRRNVFPRAGLRLTVDADQGGAVEVRVAGRIIALDVGVKVELRGAGLLGDVDTNRRAAVDVVAAQLRDGAGGLTSVSKAALRGLVADTDDYRVLDLGYTADYVSDGMRLHDDSPTLAVTELDSVWIRAVVEAPEGSA